MMMKHYLLAVCLAFFGGDAFSQVVINELDTDSPGTDTVEFIELKTPAGNASLNGYVLVLINGSNDQVYYNMDLDGLTTDVNGLLVIGASGVSPVPSVYFSFDSLMQNGADAAVIYSGNPSDYPYSSAVSSNNMLSALVYGTGDADDAELLSTLGVAVQYDENANSLGTTQSIQRKPDGTYEVKAPTPGAHNDGSGTTFNGVTIALGGTEFTEGTTFTLTFTTQTTLTSELSFSYTLTNGSFTTEDYTGLTSISMPAGTTSFTTNIVLTDDALDEGDEMLKVTLGTLPPAYIKLNDNVTAYVIDNDFTTSVWGTPLNPTYGMVSSTVPAGYYASLDGKSGALLKQAIQDIIANPAVVHEQNYGDVVDVLKAADQNPLNSNQVWLMYVEQPRAKYKFQSTSSNIGSWNREHIFPQSRGGFSDGTSATADGIDVWETTDADDIMAGHGDAHHIRSEDGPENSSRNNRDYGLTDYNGPVNTQGSWHGDVARALFYMAVRYNALSLVNGNPPDTTMSQLGDLATLLIWNGTDPADDFEMNRNNIVYTWQHNRNPFIDYPDLANYLWGDMVGQTWYAPLAAPLYGTASVAFYPNPARDHLILKGVASGSLEVYAMNGTRVLLRDFIENQSVHIELPAGIYLMKIISGAQVMARKLVINRK